MYSFLGFEGGGGEEPGLQGDPREESRKGATKNSENIQKMISRLSLS